jgi:hypothetical protein
MLTPKQAYERLIRDNRRGMDDPIEPCYPVRWWFGADGILRSAPWRCGGTRYPEYRLPRETGKDGAA